jgi:8-oxo-dGTP diphosphatase
VESVQHGQCMANKEKKRPSLGAGIIIQKDDCVLMGFREKKFGYGKLCLPGGHIEMFETAEIAVRRECLEECGLKVGKVELIGFTEDFYPKEDKHYVTIFFTGEYVGGKPKEMEPDKISNWTWYKIADLKNMQDQLWEPCIDKFRKLGWI